MDLKKYLSVHALGFGIGGLLWGLALYSELPDLGYSFHHLAIISMAFFGGLALIWPNWYIKNITKSVLGGLIGWSISWFLYPIINYLFYSSGIIFLSVIPAYFFDFFMNDEISAVTIGSSREIFIDVTSTTFLVLGAIISFFYALFLKRKIWDLVWKGSLGLALGSTIGPVIGNLLGYLFNSTLLSYLIAFSLMGIIFGIFLSWGMYRYKK